MTIDTEKAEPNRRHKPISAVLHKAPEGSTCQGLVTEVNVAIGEAVDKGQQIYSVEYNGMMYQNVAPGAGVIVSLNVAPGGAAPSTGEPSYALLRLDHPDFTSTFVPPDIDKVGGFDLDPPDSRPLAPPKSAGEEDSEGGIGAKFRRAIARAFVKPDLEAVARAQAEEVRHKMPEFLERVRASCCIRTPDEALVWRVAFGSGKEEGVATIIKNVTEQIEDLLQRGADASFIRGAMDSEVFDWRRSWAFLEEFLEQLALRRYQARKLPENSGSVYRVRCLASSWPHISAAVRSKFGSELAKMVLHARLCAEAEIHRLAVLDHVGLRDKFTLTLTSDAEWNGDLYSVASLKLASLMQLHEQICEAFSAGAEQFPCFGDAWKREVHRAHLVVLFQSRRLWEGWTPQMLIDSVHAIHGVVEGYDAYSPLAGGPGKKRIDGTGQCEAQEMSDEEYENWCGMREELAGLLVSWKETEYPTRLKEFRQKLEAAVTVGQAEVIKRDIGEYEQELSRVNSALKAYYLANHERDRHYKRVAAAEEAVRRAESAADIAEWERKRQADHERWERFTAKQEVEARHREIVGELKQIKLVGIAGVVENILSRRG